MRFDFFAVVIETSAHEQEVIVLGEKKAEQNSIVGIVRKLL